MALPVDLVEGTRVRIRQKFSWGDAGDEGHITGQPDNNGNFRIDIVHPVNKPPLFGVPPGILEIM